jgi:methionine aminotransferase
MLHPESKLPHTGNSIFSVISQWSQQYDAINLGQGYPNFDAPEELRALVKQYLDAGKNQYAPMPGILELRQVLARKIDHLYGRSIDPEKEICITAGATQALFTAITALIHKGDEVIIFEPAYDSYAPAIRLMGATVVGYALEAPDFSIDWNKFRELVTDKTRMVIVNTPHNPIGKCFKKEDWNTLATIVKDSPIIILSDEVYEHLVFDGLDHESVLKYNDLFPRSLAVYSFGKTFHNTGWKMGYCIASQSLMQEFKKVHQFNVFSVNSFIQYALADYLQNPDHYLELPQFYQTKRDLFALKMQSSRFRPLPSEGSYFQLYDYSEISALDDLAFAKKLIMDHQVASIPVSAFYSDHRQQGLIRFCFAKTDSLLTEAAAKLCLI